MSSIYLIDYYSNGIESFVHQRTTPAKIIFLLLILSSIVISHSLSFLIAILFLIIILIFLSRLSFAKLIKWALYPAFFAAIFALSQIKNPSLSLQTMLRATDAALLCLLIICTTPYPKIFSLISKVSPFLANIFFLTYQFIFLLIDGIEVRVKMMRIRGGYSGGIMRSLKNVGLTISHFLIHSVEKSERFYNFLIARGFRGAIHTRIDYRFNFLDLLLIGIGLEVLTIAIIIKLI